MDSGHPPGATLAGKAPAGAGAGARRHANTGRARARGRAYFLCIFVLFIYHCTVFYAQRVRAGGAVAQACIISNII